MLEMREEPERHEAMSYVDSPRAAREDIELQTVHRREESMRRTRLHSKSTHRPAAETRVMKAYREAHPICEACKMEQTTDAHHIVSEKTGGPTEDWNLLALCYYCHVPGVHTLGRVRFEARYPHLAPKMTAALIRCGRKTT